MTPDELEQIKVAIAKTKDTTAINSLIAEVERLRAENEALKKPPEPIRFAASKDGKKMFCLQGEKITEISLEEIENVTKLD